MPMIELTFPHGALQDEARAALIDRLTRTVGRWEGMSESEQVASSIWAFVDERPAESINAAGRPAARPRYRVQITVAEGSLDERRKSGLVAEVTEQVLEAEGSANEPRQAARVWVHLHELPDGNWGAVGRIWHLRDIVQFAGIELDRLPDEPP
jgi:phenylpyruvate tautomerase PptA (4-oxalocrotonate tautomerase family)